MITYNNTLIEYFKADDTQFKKYVNQMFEESRLSSFIEYLEGFFKTIGIVSTNILPIDTRKWMSYYELSEDNLFSKKADRTLSNEYPVSRKEAEDKLAENIIELLSVVDMSEVNNRIN
ncbi:MAG: hypothetical protein HRT69_18665 [Flavobacteriaceae bacterium]|nr:hypothetical protein [Flavobacteriaceae bacterium]